ncbi:hypothetical protein M6B38_168980 [Iris pallida]|uniref:Uncharacterized protein n=1 Tax=Iris pallida TaxID=29817 RepID=A0AAX6EV62_IRIPA|nr:hypothetical protein M6B38_168980 [Iris pallida]
MTPFSRSYITLIIQNTFYFICHVLHSSFSFTYCTFTMLRFILICSICLLYCTLVMGLGSVRKKGYNPGPCLV